MTLKRIAAVFVAVFSLCAVLSPAFAHHGWGGYRTDVELTVTVTEVRLGNPHDRLVATDGKGEEWQLLLAPPARNRRFGFNEDSVAVGDSLEIFGQRHPSRQEVKVHCIFAGGETLYTYRYNSGTSSLKRRGREERC